jgi:hypothetical protein
MREGNIDPVARLAMREGSDEPPRISTVTVSQLYAIYCAGHAEARTLSDGGVLLRAFEVTVAAAGLRQLERVILELALHDATNGTAMRSRQAFERAVEQGAKLLRSLGLRE